MITTGFVLNSGRHYWEVEILDIMPVNVGVCKPGLATDAWVCFADSSEGWFMHTDEGTLWGNGKRGSNKAGDYWEGDRLGVLLDLDEGSVLFFRNGHVHGPGYPAGSVTGPVVHALQVFETPDGRSGSARLLKNATWPAGHAK